METDMAIVSYSVYLGLAFVLTVWVGRTLGSNGYHFIKDVFAGDEELATAVNKLLQVGFYLLNLGFVVFWMPVTEAIHTPRDVFETVAFKLGAVLLILGAMHVLNVVVLNRIRRNGNASAGSLSRLEPPPPSSEPKPKVAT
ncbi:hypothetical protein [Natronoglycomyces albus]|uniref:Uncharacterized protein n=1 Tax=Natronoglycomyces albus TaxID=2811108 RepID=A0A895XPG4_9ACTN|nr:hypothetical protein [Natronoglycomyces albus]QSB05269.1 hypothetical protein JQS30_16195 [Natronoglycomyces albus]